MDKHSGYLRMSPDFTGQDDRKRGRRRKSSRVNGLVGRDCQRVQKMTLVSAFYRALSLTDGERVLIRITTWVSLPPS